MRQQCVCFVLLPVLFPYRGSRMWALSSESKIDHADITFNILHYIFLSSNFMEEISPNPETCSTNT